MPANQGQWQGSEGFKRGNPKRVMDVIPIASLIAGTPTGETVETVYLKLNGLTGNLKLALGVSIQRAESNIPLDLPQGAVVFQLYPFTNNGGRLIFARPIFQDPTATDNHNNPLPQDAPFVWEGEFTEADGVLMEVSITNSLFAGFAEPGLIVATATVEYNGSWWDVDAFTFALANVQFEGAPDLLLLKAGLE